MSTGKPSQSAMQEAATEAAKFLGYTTLKDEQMSVITSFVRGNDVFAVLPTGFGKSFCYTCLPLVFYHLLQPEVVVVTPFTAIMKDQTG